MNQEPENLESLINFKFLETIRHLSESFGEKVPLDVVKSHSGMDDETFDANVKVLKMSNKIQFGFGSAYGIKMEFVQLL